MKDVAITVKEVEKDEKRDSVRHNIYREEKSLWKNGIRHKYCPCK